MQLQIITPPYTNMPVSLDEAKAFLRIVSTNDDELISSLIQTAAVQVEKQTGQTLISTQYQLTLSDWSDLHQHHSHCFGYDPLLWNRDYTGRSLEKLPRWPLVSVDSFKVDGSTFTDYGIYSTSPSTLRIHHPHRPIAYEGGIVIKFTAGYAARENIPQTLKTAIKLLVSQWYNNRDGSTEIPLGIMNLLNLESFDSVS